MAWSTPRDWTDGEAIRRDVLNSAIRDELRELDVAIVQAAGDLFYATGAHQLARLPIGAEGAVLMVVAGQPVWV